ncbi:MAG: hypothetical protein VXX31_13605, partial [Planctomycetota bacterium]|nr:hypothetical protein [Planctomycetota bacterium]
DHLKNEGKRSSTRLRTDLRYKNSNGDFAASPGLNERENDAELLLFTREYRKNAAILTAKERSTRYDEEVMLPDLAMTFKLCNSRS